MCKYSLVFLTLFRFRLFEVCLCFWLLLALPDWIHNSDSNYNMGLLKRRQKATADIQFCSAGKDAMKPNVWTSEDLINGTASFRIPPGTRCTRATVSLKGVITIKTNESLPGSLQPNWRVERVKVLSVGKDVQFRPMPAPHSGIEASFQFDLKECARHSALQTGLPPSVDSRSESRDSKTFANTDSKALYDVTYSITAAAYSGSDLVASTTEGVTLLPLGQADPPSYGSLEVVGEHFTARTENSRSMLSMSKGVSHQVDAVAQEPLPLKIQPQGGASDPSTTVDLVLKVSPRESEALSHLPRQAHLHTQLVQKTRITPNGANAEDTSRRRKEDPDAQSLSKKRNAQDCTLATSQWETYQPDGEDAPGFAIARLSFMYRHPESARLTPTFSTPLLSRSYALDIKASFPEDGGQILKLSLPVQVMYESAAYPVAGGEVIGAALEPKMSAQSCVSEIPQRA